MFIAVSGELSPSPPCKTISTCSSTARPTFAPTSCDPARLAGHVSSANLHIGWSHFRERVRPVSLVG
jgi:hypothetical protein